jgi:hypothetical protein
MSRLYCDDQDLQGVGVAIRTTLARLEASVAAHDLYVSPITYLPYHEAPPFTDEMDALLHKRHGFAAESELRLLKFDVAHYNALVPKDASVPELPNHTYLNWVLSDVIDEIVVSPYADEDYEDWVRRAIGAKDPNLVDRVVRFCCCATPPRSAGPPDGSAIPSGRRRPSPSNTLITSTTTNKMTNKIPVNIKMA